MLVRLLLGTVTMAAAGYAVKGYCEDEGCPWESKKRSSESDYSDKEEKEPQEELSYKKAIEFHKTKKGFYKSSMKSYQKFLDKYSLIDEEINTDSKLVKQKFSDDMIDEDIESYMKQINDILDILSYNLSLGMKVSALGKDEPTQESITQLRGYAKSIYTLSHISFFVVGWTNKIIQITNKNVATQFNKENILEALVTAMSLSMQKESIHVDLSGELDASSTEKDESINYTNRGELQ